MTEPNRERVYYLRWTLVERWQHWIVAASFVLLALTGFALKYPEAWWVRPFESIEAGFGGRGLLHRLAATVFTAVALFHLGYMAFTSRGRELLRALLPTRMDAKDVVHNVAYLAGRRRDPATHDHFSYAEKAEYWALVWGTVIMGVTGAGLWFEWLTLKFLPLWAIQIFTTIHLYEAWLATLAILVWHFYFVIFNPETYPLNTSMVTGLLSEHHMAIEHGRELAQLKELEAQSAAASGSESAARPPRTGGSARG